MAANDQIWFYQVAGETIGPFTSKKMIQMANDGTIDRFTLVRRTSTGDWLSAESVKGFHFDSPARQSVEEFDNDILAQLPPVPLAPAPTLPTVRPPQPAERKRARITLDTLLFTWTRSLSYFMIAALLLMGLGYSVMFLLSLRSSALPKTMTLAELREANAPVAATEDANDSRATTLFGVDIGPNLQKLIKADPQVHEIVLLCLRGSEPDIQNSMMNHLEAFAAEVDAGNLKPNERRRILEKFLFRQPYRIIEYQSELEEKKAARGDAVTKVLSAIGLSILVCLVLVLLGIERNTRDR